MPRKTKLEQPSRITPLTNIEENNAARDVYERLDSYRTTLSYDFTADGRYFYLRESNSRLLYQDQTRYYWTFSFRGENIAVFRDTRRKPSGIKGVRSKTTNRYWFSEPLSLEDYIELRMLIP